VSGQLVREPRLANRGFANNQTQPSTTSQDVGKAPQEQVQLSLPTDENRAADISPIFELGRRLERRILVEDRLM